MTTALTWQARHRAVVRDPLVTPAPSRPTFVLGAVQCTDHPLEAACRYQVTWAINPHMQTGAVDFGLAAVQHARLAAALESAGATIVGLPFIHGAYDSVFVKDQALLLARRSGRRALVAKFRYAERARERLARSHLLARLGYDVVADEACPPWEGGDVVMLPGGAGMCLGHGFRTQRAAAHWLERHVGAAVLPLELVDPHLYHLDMALSIRPDGTALVCPDALAPGSLAALERILDPARTVRVGRDLALAFALNVVVIGDTIVCGTRTRMLDAQLSARGYRTITVPLDQFHLAGGSAACLVATVHRDPAEAG